VHRVRSTSAGCGRAGCAFVLSCTWLGLACEAGAPASSASRWSPVEELPAPPPHRPSEASCALGRSCAQVAEQSLSLTRLPVELGAQCRGSSSRQLRESPAARRPRCRGIEEPWAHALRTSCCCSGSSSLFQVLYRWLTRESVAYELVAACWGPDGSCLGRPAAPQRIQHWLQAWFPGRPASTSFPPDYTWQL